MHSENLNINQWGKIIVNIFIILLFICINPLFALIFCGFLNLTNTRINFWLFTFMFALSFSLLYTLKDYNQLSGIGADVNFYITSFQTIKDLSWLEIFYRFINRPNGNEPLYWLYVKIANLIFFGDGEIFTLFHYFFTFASIAYLAKIIDTNKFVIIIVCILFLNFNILTGIPLFRQTMSFLLFFTILSILDGDWIFPRRKQTK